MSPQGLFAPRQKFLDLVLTKSRFFGENPGFIYHRPVFVTSRAVSVHSNGHRIHNQYKHPLSKSVAGLMFPLSDYLVIVDPARTQYRAQPSAVVCY